MDASTQPSTARPSTGRRIRRLAVAAAAVLGFTAAAHAQEQMSVDLELVLAVDISQSMSPSEQGLQRNGYIDAFRHKDVINALMSGPHGRIAVTYMEWAGDFQPWQTVEWTIIDSAASANAFADRLAEEPVFGEQRTSISTALMMATQLIESNGIASNRRVIDVSGDGANNAGRPVEPVRDEVVKRGITINGLPIILEKPREFYDIDHLDRYYKHCVIGGSAAFIAPVFDLKHMAATIRKKLVLEIAGVMVAPETAPVQFAEAETQESGEPGLQRIQLKLPTEKTDCLVGEKVWGDRRGGWGGGFGDFPR
jgi:hypothetical protein